MSRLYKFFLILFGALLLVSIVYGTLISWITYQVIRSTVAQVGLKDSSFSVFVTLGLVQGILYASVLLLMIIGLFYRSLQHGQKFTVRNIIAVAVWFYFLTTVAYILHYVSFSGFDFSAVFLLGGPQVFLESGMWVPFVIAWLVLYFILLTRIKKTAEHGR